MTAKVVALVLAAGALLGVTPPEARADDVKVIFIELSLHTFTYYPSWGSCMGSERNKGLMPSVGVALEGVNNHELSLGQADEDTQYSPKPVPDVCTLKATVRVNRPDTRYRVKWGDRDWETGLYQAGPMRGSTAGDSYIYM